MSCSTQLHAQEWSVHAGAGIGYDAFLRDKSIETAKNKWPFEPGVSLRGGLAYQTSSGFNVFLATIAGYDRIRQPVPDVSNSGAWVNTIHLKFLAGSGPVIPSGDKGNTITPFIQLGAGFYSLAGNVSSSSSTNDHLTMHLVDETSDNWAILVGAGIEWRFEAIVSSGINLQFTYTPLNVFHDPVRYTAVNDKASYDLALQGKFLQVLLSYSVHWKFKRKE